MYVKEWMVVHSLSIREDIFCLNKAQIIVGQKIYSKLLRFLNVLNSIMAGKYIQRVKNFIVPFLNKNGFNLVLCEFVKEEGSFHLRLFIALSEEEKTKRLAKISLISSEAEYKQESKDGEDTNKVGINIDDCVKVSRYLSSWLDKEDFIRETYTLEVCSTGFLDGRTE